MYQKYTFKSGHICGTLLTPFLACLVLALWTGLSGLLVYADQSSGLLTVIFPHA